MPPASKDTIAGVLGPSLHQLALHDLHEGISRTHIFHCVSISWGDATKEKCRKYVPMHCYLGTYEQPSVKSIWPGRGIAMSARIGFFCEG